MHGTLPRVAPRVTSKAAMLIAHDLRRAHRGRRCWCLGGRRAAVWWHDDAPGGSRAACGGGHSVSGARDAWLIAWRMNDAPPQAWTARMMWMFAGRATGSLRDWPATGPCRYQPDSGRTDHRGRLLLRSHGDEEQLGQLLDQILTIAPPTWRTNDVGGKRHLWDHWNPFYGCRARGS